MRGIVHLGAGIATAALVVPHLPGASPQAAFAAMTILGAILPDIDAKGSLAAEALPPLRWLYLLLSRLFGQRHHRGITHTLLFTALGSFVMFLLFLSASIGAGLLMAFGWAAGVVSHLVLDMLTPAGVAILAPFSGIRLSLLPRFIRKLLSGI